MQRSAQAAVDPQTKPPDWGCESACRQLTATTTIAIYYYYSARKLIRMAVFQLRLLRARSSAVESRVSTAIQRQRARGGVRRRAHFAPRHTGAIERVSTFKLLGIHLDKPLISWSTHINNITSKASKQLCFLEQLKRAGVPYFYKQLLHFYTAVIRPVLEYAVPTWHHLINHTQAQQLEAVQNGLSI